MREWTQDWREDRLVMERVCSHGCGHPDPDHLAFIEREFGELFARAESIHRCDGCCDGYW